MYAYMYSINAIVHSQIQRDPRDNEIVIEYYKTDKALSIIHNLEPKGREFGELALQPAAELLCLLIIQLRIWAIYKMYKVLEYFVSVL